MASDPKRITFETHPKLLLDIVERQAGTLEKGIVEAAMNAIEAGSPFFKIEAEFKGDGNTTGDKRIVMTDNGKGIVTREDLERYFRTFGTPHRENENKKWAQFRMGRGQCFAQGRNLWRTACWQMRTDVRDDVAHDRQLSFELTETEDHFDGCRIEIDLYHNKFYGTVESLSDRVKEQLEFVEEQIIFNGVQLNRPPSTLKWTHEDDDAYYLFGKGQDLIIYNMGVKVQKIPASIAGVIGVVVSKSQLKVNFARNEVLTECPIMQRINKVIVANRQKKSRKTPTRLDKSERIAVLLSMRDGNESYSDMQSVGLFFTTSGRSLTFRDIYSTRIPWSFGEEGDMLSDKIMQAGQGLVIDRSCMDELNYTGYPQKFFQWITSRCEGPDWSLFEGLYLPIDTLMVGMSRSSTFIPREKWTKWEKRVVKTLESFHCWENRAIGIGLSDCALAWTDGRTYITLERNYIRDASLIDIMLTMVHEMAHDERTDQSHIHGARFYENFHNLMLYGNRQGNHTKGESPMEWSAVFCARLTQERRNEMTQAAILKEQKAKERLDRALAGKGTKVAARSIQTKGPKLKRRPRRRVRSLLNIE